MRICISIARPSPRLEIRRSAPHNGDAVNGCRIIWQSANSQLYGPVVVRGANRYELVDLQARESGFAKDLDAVLAEARLQAANLRHGAAEPCRNGRHPDTALGWMVKLVQTSVATSCSPITASFQQVGLANTAGVFDLAIDFADIGAKNPLRTRCVIRCCIDER